MNGKTSTHNELSGNYREFTKACERGIAISIAQLRNEAVRLLEAKAAAIDLVMELIT
jgi:hypothetical protein